MFMNLEKILTSERLRLIPLTREYAKDIFENFNEKVTKYMYPCPAEKLSETVKIVDLFIEKRKSGLEVVYAITLIDTGEFIGLVGLHNITQPVPELGIWTKLSSHGNHYGREAIGAVIEYAKILGITKLCYPVDERNIPSRKIPQYYGGRLVESNENQVTPDGRILTIETYTIDLQ